MTVLLALSRIVWCGLFWGLRRPSRPFALAALLLGVVPRALLALATVPVAWMTSGPGWAQLIAFYCLTLLWFLWLGAIALQRPGIAAKVVFPMLVFAGVESLGTLAATADLLSVLLTGSVPASWWGTLVNLIYSIAQVIFLRTMARAAVDASPDWSRL